MVWTITIGFKETGANIHSAGFVSPSPVLKVYMYIFFYRYFRHIVYGTKQLGRSLWQREYLAPQICSMNNRFHLEAKLPWSYNYPLANHIVTNKSSANREMPQFSRLYYSSFGYLRKISGQGFKILLIA